MNSGKRNCPFEGENDKQLGVNGIHTTPKRLCIHHVTNGTAASFHSNVPMTTEMECQANINMSQQFQVETNRQSDSMNICETSCPDNTNNNNNNNSSNYNSSSSNFNMSPTAVCIRCQAGEPGHFGHIGR